jgi:hypothetical protein
MLPTNAGTLLAVSCLCACLALSGCGGSVVTSGDAGTDTSDARADDALDPAADTVPDLPADTVDEDASAGPCSTHVECLDAGYCGPCGYYECPCDPASDPECSPRCMPNPCHDGSTPVCLMPVPECAPYEVLTVVDGCYACLNVETCAPWGEPGCATSADCEPEETCDPCAHGSCPGCEDCVPGCVEHGCFTEDVLECAMIRPECEPGAVSVIRGGCWVCVDRTTCLPWGEPGCMHDSGCPPERYCDPCGTSSCPMCPDCVPACVPHGCPTEPEALCDMVRPDCGEGSVAVVRGGCWVCVDLDDCT